MFVYILVSEIDGSMYVGMSEKPDERLISFEIERDESYIKKLRKVELNFIQELKSHDHAIQYEFRGYRV